MGRFKIQSETVFDYEREVVWDFATNPNNWGRTYKGSGGMHKDTKFPLELGDTFSEKKPYQFVFQQQDGIGATEDGSSPSSEGFTTIAYRFEEVGEGKTLFVRTLTCEMPRGVGIPDDLLTVCARPDGIEKYHDAIKKELDEKHGRRGGKRDEK
ncbi:hypothetical protein MBLNU13_g06355t1 [Cladosporium sp. NU13]